jgi:NAD(P)-dependent dehydrogenase (short-subunit alcohol dehydrogenase family)
MTSHVLITGGSKRLGAELVRRFAHAGWHVWCHYQHSQAQALALQAELTQAGYQVSTVSANLAKEHELIAMMATIQAQAGVLRCVVNNASAFEPDTGLSFDNASANAQIQVNLLAPLLLGRALAKQAQAGVDHSVIHVLDQKVFNLNPDYFSYTVSKLALERSVALQAQSLAPKVRVCGVAPGLMYPSGPQTLDNFERASRVNLLRQAIDPKDVANTCVFLAENASITGSTLCVDKGQHLVPLERDVMFMVDSPSQDST